jgi:hypothetical protein
MIVAHQVYKTTGSYSAGDRRSLSGPTLVAVVKSSDLRNYYDAPAFWLLHYSRLRSVLGQRQMSSGVLVVDKITLENSTQRSSIPYDYMVQTFSANGSDQPLHVRILPWRSRCSNHFLHPHAFRDGCPVTVVDRIAVAQKISAPVVPGEPFRICCVAHSWLGCSVT